MKMLIAIIVIVLVCLCCVRKNIFHKPIVEKKIKYKEEMVVIDDGIIDKGDTFQVIEPLWFSVNIYDGEDKYLNDLKQFSIPQKYVFAIYWYRTEVNNGGHDQFYFNSTGIVWKDALDGFGEIGLEGFQSVLKESIKRMGGNPSMDRDERQEQLLDKMQADFEDLDTKYYQLEQESNLDLALLEYINQNRESFYFDGLVKKPDGWEK